MDLRPLESLLTPEQSAQVVSFLEDLYLQNQTSNLTRVAPEEAVTRHVLDSLLLLEFLPDSGRVLDIGCGPGFPVWPLALARPDIEFTAMDSAGKMLRFLKRHPLENLTVRQHRAEDVDAREGYDFVTGRAVAPFPIQMEISAAWVRKGGCFLPLRTPVEKPLISAAPAKLLGLELVANYERALPGTDVVRLLPELRKVARTPKLYPRSWANIRQKPLSSSASGRTQST